MRFKLTRFDLLVLDSIRSMDTQAVEPSWHLAVDRENYASYAQSLYSRNGIYMLPARLSVFISDGTSCHLNKTPDAIG